MITIDVLSTNPSMKMGLAFNLTTCALHIRHSLINQIKSLQSTKLKICNVRSAVTGGLSVSLMLKLQHTVLPTCEQMWHSLKYTADLMTYISEWKPCVEALAGSQSLYCLDTVYREG